MENTNNERNNPQSGNGDGISFSLLRHIGVLSTSNTGWAKEVNLVSWNGGKPKYDIRDWSPDHEKMTKGLRITPFEARQLRDILNKTDLDQPLPDMEGKADAGPCDDDGETPEGHGEATDAEAKMKEDGTPF